MDDSNNPPRQPAPNESTVRFDAARAWRGASGLFKGNKEMLLVLAGLFFFVPQMLLGMFLPDVPQGLEGEEAGKAALAIFGTWWPLVLAATLVQTAGVLAIMALLCAPERPTVREAISASIKLLPPYVAATLVLVAGVGLAALLIMIPFSLAAGQAGAGIAMVPVFAAAIWVNVRTLTLAPVVAAERETNPFEALKRSWRLTAGNGGRLLLLVVLFLLAALIISVVATTVPGSILIAVFGQETGRAVVGVIEALVSAALMAVWATLLVSSYRQLAR